MSWEDGVFKTPEDIKAYGDARVAAERERIVELLIENKVLSWESNFDSEIIALIYGETNE